MAGRIVGSLSRCGLTLGLLCGIAQAACAAETETDAVVPAGPEAGTLFDFDIPAQALEQALYQYGDTTHQPALFPSALVAGLSSTAVRGRFTADAALRRLLQGTGLVGAKTASAQGDIFLLRRGTPERDTAPARADDDLDGDPARIQAGVLRALCADARTAPGSYRALFRVRVDAAGLVDDAALIDSTGDRGRDAALLAVLRRTRISAPPSTPSSYTMALAPVSRGSASPCGVNPGGAR